MGRKTTRREFMLGRGGGDVSGGDSGGSVPRPVGSAESPPLLHVSRRAMGGEFQIFLKAGQYPHGLPKALEALDMLEPLEQQMSVFRPDSEIQRINQQAAQQPVEVEPRLFDLLQLAEKIHHQTEGAFDPTATPLWEVWGFARGQGRVPTETELAEARRRVGWQYVVLNPADRTIRFTRPGIELNLGGIGKGYAVDRCAEVLLEAGIEEFLIHGGQSSVLAHGRGGNGAGFQGWRVGIRHPLRPKRRLGELDLKDRALGTSGSGVQFFRHQGRRLGHILDPRTGEPGEGVLSVTVLAPSAAEADALATGLFLLGVEKTRKLCEQRPEIAAIFVRHTPRSGCVEVVPIGISEPVWHPG